MIPNCKGCRWRPKSICRFESPQLEPNPFRILKQHLYPDDKYFCSHFDPLPDEKHCGNCEFSWERDDKRLLCVDSDCYVLPFKPACRHWKADWKEEK